jgi:hypothetical protein
MSLAKDLTGEIRTCTRCGQRKKILSQGYPYKDKLGNTVPNRLICEDCVRLDFEKKESSKGYNLE